MLEGDCDAQLLMRRRVQDWVNRETIHAKVTAVMSAAAFQSYIRWSHWGAVMNLILGTLAFTLPFNVMIFYLSAFFPILIVTSDAYFFSM